MSLKLAIVAYWPTLTIYTYKQPTIDFLGGRNMVQSPIALYNADI